MVREYVDGETRRKQICEEALKILARQGMKNLTIRKVADRMGLVPSAVYRHYSSKEKILDAVLELIGKKLHAYIDEVLNDHDSPVDALYNLLLRHVHFLVEELGAGGSFLTIEILVLYPEKKGIVIENTAYMGIAAAKLIKEGQEKGFFREAPVKELTNMYIGLFSTAVLRYQLFGGNYDLDGEVKGNWKVFYELIKR